MSIYGLFARNGPSGFGYRSTAEQVTEGLSLAGQTVLLTGCNSGLGLEAMRVLVLRGAKVIGTARSLDKAEAACAGVGGETVPLACELSEPASVRACVEAVTRTGVLLDAIICNAGIMAPPRLETKHGYELQFFTNHIGHFILVTGLLGRLSASARVVMLSSDLHKIAPKAGVEFDNLDGAKRYAPWRNYGQSKLANILFAVQLSRRFAGTQRTANAVHPGVIATNLSRHMNPVLSALQRTTAPLFLKSIPQGAATEVFVATHPSVAGVSGQYFADSNVARPSAQANDAGLAERLWSVSQRIVAEVSP
ncbi:MAG TPA: SDR family oxidoreductase [Polyangiaceae bacterium]|nr:SDR family oxidoreductase [Polyangiaceae bacterium]